MLLFLDQLSKYIIEKKFYLYETQEISNFFNITFIVNYGFAFGILNDQKLSQTLVILIISVIILYIFFLLAKNNQFIIKVSLSLILSGAIGNLIDRIARGYVVDFLDFNYLEIHWPAFNFADSYITIGFIILLYSIIRNEKFDL